MSQVINTNVLSLNAQRNLSRSGIALATAMQRLSSGVRINSARDDAAGLAIAERFTTQIRGLNQAIRNANDGISLAQTGEGALAEIGNNLQRIRELAVQAANATNSDADRAALDREVAQRLAEIDRIAGQTTFNGRRILDGSFGEAHFQVGANVGDTINLALDSSMRTARIGAVAVVDGAALGEDVLPLHVDGNLRIQLGDGPSLSVADGVYHSAEALVEAFNRALGERGRAEVNPAGGIRLSAPQSITIDAGSELGSLGLAAHSPPGGSLASTHVRTVVAANETLDRVDAALTAVSAMRSRFGAIQNRFESTIANLSTTVENLSASRSRIMDADFAAEITRLVRAQILQQAGIAILSQANLMPRNILNLLFNA